MVASVNITGFFGQPLGGLVTVFTNSGIPRISDFVKVLGNGRDDSY